MDVYLVGTSDDVSAIYSNEQAARDHVDTEGKGYLWVWRITVEDEYGPRKDWGDEDGDRAIYPHPDEQERRRRHRY